MKKNELTKYEMEILENNKKARKWKEKRYTYDYFMRKYNRMTRR